MSTPQAMRWFLAAAALASAVHAQQPPSNLGFEAHDASGRPAAWGIGGDGFELVVDSVAPFAGRFSLRTRWLDAVPYSAESRTFAVTNQGFPLARAAGRRLHLSGWIRTENIGVGFAGL